MLTEPGLAERYAAKAARRGKDFGRDRLVRETEDFLKREYFKKTENVNGH